MKSRECILLGFVIVIVNIVVLGCLSPPQNVKKDDDQLVIIGVVVFANGNAVPDSMNCTVSYFDHKTGKQVTKPVEKGAFSLKDLADEKYKLEAVAKVENMKGSIYFTIRNNQLQGSTDKNLILRVELGTEDIEAAPVPPDFFKPEVIRSIGIIRDK